MNVIAIFNGPNLNLLGEREPAIYGATTLAELESMCRDHAQAAGAAIDFRQTNHEGVLIDAIHEVRGSAAGMVINAGGWTHTSVAIRDALAAVAAPKVEVHISDILAREPFRAHSYLTPVCDSLITGHGVNGYLEAIDLILQLNGRST